MFWINSTLICQQNQIVCPPVHVHLWNPSPPLSISSCYFFQSLELNQTCEPFNKIYWVFIKWRDYGRLKMAANTIEKWGLSPLPLTLHRLWDYFDQQNMAEGFLCPFRGPARKKEATSTSCLLEHSCLELGTSNRTQKFCGSDTGILESPLSGPQSQLTPGWRLWE